MVNKTLKWVGSIITTLLIAAIMFSIIIMIINRKTPDRVPSIAGYKFMAVLSGSMQPVLKAGDMIVSKEKPPESIKVGDIITYRMAENILVTHRVIEIANNNGKPMFKTKGDANNVDDNKFISPDQLIGVLLFSIPYGGYAASFVRSRTGFILLIIIPVVLLILGELKTVLSVKEENKKDLHDINDDVKK